MDKTKQIDILEVLLRFGALTLGVMVWLAFMAGLGRALYFIVTKPFVCP